MNRVVFRFLLFMLFNGSFATFCQEAKGTNDEVFLTGFFGGFDTNSHSFWMKRDQLPQHELWAPGEQPFPLDLSVEATRAKTFLIGRDHITNRLDLENISIKRAGFYNQRSNTTNDLASENDWASVWVVRLEFLEQNGLPGPSKHVAMLLDGSYASERTRPKSHSEYLMLEKRPDSPPAITTTLKTNNNALETSYVQKGSPLAEVYRDDFVIPKVQWDPSYAFPMDLNAAATNAFNYLTQTNNMPQDYILHSVTLSGYVPLKAIEAANDTVLNHWHHWVIECEFHSKSQPYPAYFLYMLLDGRVLCVTELTG